MLKKPKPPPARQFMVFHDVGQPAMTICVDFDELAGSWPGVYTRPLIHGQPVDPPQIRCGIVQLKCGVALCVKELADEVADKIAQTLARIEGRR